MTDNQLAGYFSYLDRLNRMAITNMRRAAFYLECRFLIDREQADAILQAWLSTPTQCHRTVAELDCLERPARSGRAQNIGISTAVPSA